MSHGGLLSRQDGLTAQGLRGGDNGDYRGQHIDRVDTDNDTKYDNTKKRGPTGIRRIPLTSRSGECQRGLANTHAHTYALLTMHALIHAPIPYARNSHTRQPEPALHIPTHLPLVPRHANLPQIQCTPTQILDNVSSRTSSSVATCANGSQSAREIIRECGAPPARTTHNPPQHTALAPHMPSTSHTWFLIPET